MSYRTVELAWTPRSTTEWATFSAGRREAARLWNDLVLRHHRIRRLALRWPSKARWQRWAKGRYLGLSAQSTQQRHGEFPGAGVSCPPLRTKGPNRARQPRPPHRHHRVGEPHHETRIPAARLAQPP